MTDSFTRLINAVGRGRAPHTTLISSPDREEARLCGRRYAAALLNCAEDELAVHPDYKEFEDTAVKVVDIRSYLMSEMSKRPFRGGSRVIHFPNAQALAVQNQNVLLQILEEPPAGTYFVLSGNESGILATVRSRAAVVRLPAVNDAEVAARLGLDARTGARIAAAGEGVMSRSAALAEPAAMDERIKSLTAFARFLVEEHTVAAADAMPRERGTAKDSADDMLLFAADMLTLSVGGTRLRFPELKAWSGRCAERFTRAEINCIIDMLADHRTRLDTNASAGQAVDSLFSRLLEEIWSR